MKEMTQHEMDALLSSASYGHLGLSINDEPYVVPVAFGYLEGKIYIHGSKSGKRVDYVKRNPKVCFQVDKYDPDGSWKSVIIYGNANLSNDTDLKLKWLKSVAQNSPRPMKADRATAEKMDVTVCEINIEQITGRASGSSHG